MEENLHPSPPALDLYNRAAGWAKFLAIVGLAVVVLLLVGASYCIHLLHTTPNLKEVDENLPWVATSLAWGMPVMALIYGIPMLMLFRFASSARRSARTLDQQALEESFRRLHSFFRYMGILAIVVFGIYFLCFVVIGSAALMGLGEQ